MKLTLAGDTSAIQGSGGFVNIKMDELFLRRPISVCDYDDKTLTLIYKIVGKGTEKLAEMENGTELDLLVGLGNGYDLSKSGAAPLLIGGGVGVPPLYKLAKLLLAEGKRVQVVLGFNSGADVFYEDEFRALGADVRVTTADGSYGTKGFVTDAMGDLDYTYFYTCGPEPMLKAVHKATKTSGQMSFEERMGCGFGACMGCSCKTLTGYKRICKEGPVMEKEEILW
ncbi:MAG: dihydroorotate dehydrogenase electron transfer subunit [Clostridia bacterium]|nr:dihydroorotate dehydrogenase electron transfer subunit [Clostridia bacterium]